MFVRLWLMFQFERTSPVCVIHPEHIIKDKISEIYTSILNQQKNFRTHNKNYYKALPPINTVSERALMLQIFAIRFNWLGVLYLLKFTYDNPDILGQWV